MCFSSSITSSVLPRPDPRFRRFWAGCLRLSDISRTWPPKWESCRSESPRPNMARSLRSRRSMFRRTIIRILLLRQRLPTWMRRRTWSEGLWSLGFIPLWIRWHRHPESWIHECRGRALQCRPGGESGYFSATRICRISLPFLE